MAKKRSNGEGSWFKRTINGTQYYAFKKKYENDEKFKTFYGKTQQEVKEKIAEFEENRKKPVTDDVSTTVGELVEHYVRVVRKPKLTPRGYDSYETLIKSQIKNLKEYDIYNVTLQNLTRDKCRLYVSGLQEHGYAPKTIKKVVGLIKAALQDAVDEGTISTNPMNGVELPRIVKSKKTFLTLEEVESFYKMALHIEKPGERFNHAIPEGDYSYGNNGLALAFISMTGLRVSEMIALTWDNVDLEHRLIHINSNFSEVNKRDDYGELIRDENGLVVKDIIIKEPKTESGIRSVPLNQNAIAVLKLLYKEKNPPHNLVAFSKKTNSYLQKDALRLTCKRICGRAGIPEVSPHGLRHAFGAVIIHKKHVDAQVVSKLLGHSDVSTTYEYYSDVYADILAQSVDVFNDDSKPQ